MNIVSSDYAALGADYIRQHSFRWLDRKSSRTFVFVWTRRVVKYRPVYYDFFVIVDGCLWPVLTSLDVAGGALECMNACRNGVCSRWHGMPLCGHRVSGKR